MSTFRSRIVLAAIVAASLLLNACVSLQESVAERVIAKVDAASTPSSSAPSIEPATLPLRATIVSHLNNAAEIAKAAGDAPGVACWSTLGKWVETLPLAHTAPAPEPTLPEATGPAGRAELARIRAKLAEQRIGAVKARVAALRAIVDAGVPDEVVTACAAVVNDARSIASRLLTVIGLVL